MSDSEWGIPTDDSEEVEFQDINSEDEEDVDDAVEEIAQKAGEKLEEALENKTVTPEESEVIETNWARDSAKERYGVTLRRHILEGTISEIHTKEEQEELRDNLDSVIDVELLQEAKELVEDEDARSIFGDRIEELGDCSTDHLIKQGEYRYLPVFGFNINHVCTVPYRDADAEDYEFDSIFIGDKLLSWWEGSSITPRHPYLLLNPIDSTKNTNHTADGVPYREIFRLPKGQQLSFSDSGGFQMVSRKKAGRVDNPADHDWQNAVLHPETVLDWQINNADSGAILDHPPYITEGESSIFSAEDDDLERWLDDPYLTYLNRTVENANRMSQHLESRRDAGDMRAEDYKMLGVIQGHTLDEDKVPDSHSSKCLENDDYSLGERPHWYMLERWHEKLKDIRDWDGWALSPTPCTSPGQIALHLSYAHNNCGDADWFHVLQVGSAINISLIQFYSMIAEDKFVTSDASSHNRGSKYRQFMLPPGFGSSVKISDRDDDYERHPCNCKVCKTVEEEHGFEYIGDGADSKRNATMNLHNLTMQLLSQRIQDALLRAEGEDLIGGIKLNSDGSEIKRTYSDFWKLMKDVTRKSKIKDIYNAMLYLYCSVEEGMREEHSIWIKEYKYTYVERDDDEDSGMEHAKIELDDADMSGGSRGSVSEDEEGEEEDEEVQWTDEEEKYMGLPDLRMEEPDEDIEEYYYKRTVTPTEGEEMTLDPCGSVLSY